MNMTNIISLVVPLEGMVGPRLSLHERRIYHWVRCKHNVYLSIILDGSPTAVHVQFMMLSS